MPWYYLLTRHIIKVMLQFKVKNFIRTHLGPFLYVLWMVHHSAVGVIAGALARENRVHTSTN
jgi:hypothetical protein